MALTLAEPANQLADPPDHASSSIDLPALAEGIELIGRYEGSGFHEAPFLVKRRDAQIVQISRLLFLVASALQLHRHPEAVARQVSVDFGREVSADNITYLVDKKLRPTGILATPEGRTQMARANPLLALRLRLPMVPERLHRRVTTALVPLFRPVAWIPGVVAVVALDIWLVTHLGGDILRPTQELINHPQLLLPLTMLTIAMGCWHEIGHATAARYGGARPGAMGAGVYLIWPVFYTDVTDSYRLDRRGRLRVDLGGVYFNGLFTLAAGAALLATGHVLFLMFLVLAQTETLRQFLPFVRLDGYYIVSDLAGVPNPFVYLKPAVTRLADRLRRRARGHDGAPGLDALTRKARVVLTVWACVTVPVLLGNILLLLFFAPRLAGTAWSSAARQADALGAAFRAADILAVANSAIGVVFLVLPAAGIGYIMIRMLGRVPAFARRSWSARPAVTAVVGGLACLALVYQLGVVWPRTFTAAARAPGERERQAQQIVADALFHSAGGLAVAGVELAAEATPPRARPPATVPARPPATTPAPEPTTTTVPDRPSPATTGPDGSGPADASTGTATGTPSPTPAPDPTAGAAPGPGPTSAPTSPPSPTTTAAPTPTAVAPTTATTAGPTTTTTAPPEGPLDILFPLLGE